MSDAFRKFGKAYENSTPFGKELLVRLWQQVSYKGNTGFFFLRRVGRPSLLRGNRVVLWSRNDETEVVIHEGDLQ